MNKPDGSKTRSEIRHVYSHSQSGSGTLSSPPKQPVQVAVPRTQSTMESSSQVATKPDGISAYHKHLKQLEGEKQQRLRELREGGSK